MKEEQFLAYLKANCAGRKNIRTRAQLQRSLNLSKDQLTSMVHQMRCKGMPIAGGPGGYFYAQNAGELHATIRWLEKMVRTLLKSINGLAPARYARFVDVFGGSYTYDGLDASLSAPTLKEAWTSRPSTRTVA